MSDRPDGLPNPVSVTDFYLAAVLDELRVLNQGPSARQPNITVTDPPGTERVKEPERSKRR